MSTDDFELRLQRIEDRLALKSLVDRFSNLADQKDAAAQLPLFTEDATVETYFEGQLFGAFLVASRLVRDSAHTSPTSKGCTTSMGSRPSS
jgi:hypothetical protein